MGLHILCDDALKEIVSYLDIRDMRSMISVSKKIGTASSSFFRETFKGSIKKYVRAINSDIVFVDEKNIWDDIFKKYMCRVIYGRLSGLSILTIKEYDADRCKLIIENDHAEGSWRSYSLGHTEDVSKIRHMKYVNADGHGRQTKLPEVVYHGFYDTERQVCFLIGDPLQPSATFFATDIKKHHGSIWSVRLLDGREHWFAARTFNPNYKMLQDYILLDDEMIYVKKYNKVYSYFCTAISSDYKADHLADGCCVIL